jgi:hypothetical protein
MPRAARCLPLILLLLPSCGGGGGGSNGGGNGLPPGPGTFSVSPIEVAAITNLEPLGAMNPPGHTIPTDHVYFYYVPINIGPVAASEPWPVLPVRAPGSGKVSWMISSSGPNTDSKVMVDMTGDFSYYVDHVVLDPGIQVGTAVSAGQRIGQTGPYSGAVDLGVVYRAVTLAGFVNPARYQGQTLHTDSPYRYFAEPLKSQLYALVRRNAADKDGKIDYDVRGRLIGNWFHESVAVADSMGPTAWSKQLAICPDSNHPTQMRVTIGGYCGLLGKWKPSPGDPDPNQVSLASGKVAYRLLYLGDDSRAGLMLVQLLDDTRIKLQVFPGSTANDGDFTSAALIYSR